MTPSPKTRTLATSILVVVPLAAPSCAPDPLPGDGSFEEEVRAQVAVFLDDYERRAESLDADSVRLLYSSDPGFRFYEDGRLAYRSAGEIAAAIRELEGGFGAADVTLEDVRVRPLAPDRALVSGLFRQALVGPAGDFSYSGALTLLLGREEGGWVVLYGHTSTAPGGPSR